MLIRSPAAHVRKRERKRGWLLRREMLGRVRIASRSNCLSSSACSPTPWEFRHSQASAHQACCSRPRRRTECERESVRARVHILFFFGSSSRHVPPKDFDSVQIIGRSLAKDEVTFLVRCRMLNCIVLALICIPVRDKTIVCENASVAAAYTNVSVIHPIGISGRRGPSSKLAKIISSKENDSRVIVRNILRGLRNMGWSNTQFSSSRLVLLFSE